MFIWNIDKQYRFWLEFQILDGYIRHVWSPFSAKQELNKNFTWPGLHMIICLFRHVKHYLRPYRINCISCTWWNMMLLFALWRILLWSNMSTQNKSSHSLSLSTRNWIYYISLNEGGRHESKKNLTKLTCVWQVFEVTNNIDD